MRRITQRERYEFIHLFMKHASIADDQTEGQLQWAAQRLLRYGATLGRIAEEECNGPNFPNGLRPEQYNVIQERWERWMEQERKKEERIEKKVTEICERFGCKPVFSGDPRGNVLKIKVPDGYTNDWGKEGICVPTS